MSEKQIVEVIVDGGYTPNQVILKKGVPAELSFKRISDMGCLEQVIVPGSDEAFDLPLNEAKSFPINTENAGEYEFSCGMKMAKGKVVVE